MGLIGSFVLKNLPAILMGLVITGAVGYVEVLRIEVKHDKSVIATDKASLKTAAANQKALEASLSRQNSAIKAVAAEDARTQAAATKALQQAQSARATVARQVAAIAATKAGADKCTSADQLILGSLPPSS